MKTKLNNQIRKFLYGIVLGGMILSLCFGMSGSPAVRAQEGEAQTPTETLMPAEPSETALPALTPTEAPTETMVPTEPGEPPLPAEEQAWKQSGWFSIIWGDGLDGSSQTIYTLTDDSGQTSGLLLDENLAQSLGGVLSFDRKYVSVEGILADPLSAQNALATINVTSISLAPQPGTETLDDVPSAAVTGSKPWISILCKFSDYAVEPRNLAYFQGMYSNVKPGLDHYWRELSYTTANVAGSNASGWFVLPEVEAHYEHTNPAGLFHLATDCIGAADASVNYSLYTGINMMFNFDWFNGLAFGGGMYMNLDGVTKTWSTTWEPPWAYTDISVIAHEMGHGFGLPHSSGNYGATYDNAWDVMSKDRYNCAAATDPTYGCVAQHTISYHKDILGWIPAGQKFTAGPNTNTTITLEQLALPQTTNYKMAQIPINGSSTHFYTVEARRLTGYDVKLAGAAVIIHEVDTTRGIPAHVIDADNDGNTASAGAMWTVGETFSDVANGISVSVNSATATGFQVTITTSPLWTISGYVRTAGMIGIGGVTMSGLPNNPVTDASGYYSSGVVNGWSGTVTPQRTNYSFSPPSLSYTNVTSNQSNENYTGTYTYTCASGYLCVHVLNSSGLDVSSARVEVYTDLGNYPSSKSTDTAGLATFQINPGSYTLVVSSSSNHFLVVKAVSAPGLVTVDPTGTVQVNVNARLLDDSPMASALISANPSMYSFGNLGNADSSGSLTAWVTPGTFSFLAWDWSNLYYLANSGVSISGTANVELHAATMPTGQMPITLTDFSSAGVCLSSGQSASICPYYTVSSGDVIILSATDFYYWSQLQKAQGAGTTWYYGLEGKSFSITGEGNYPFTAGGDFSISSVATNVSFQPGSTISISNTITDGYDQRINNAYSYSASAAPMQAEPVFMLDEAGQPSLLDSSGIDAATYSYFYPQVTVTDPEATIISQAQTDATWYEHSFTMPDEIIAGAYNVDLTLDTGPHMGVISANATFNYQPLTLGESGLSFRYVDTFGITGEPYLADGNHLNGPNGLFIDESNGLYVVEEKGDRLLKYNSSGTNTLIIGHAGISWSHDDYLTFPKDVAVDGAGNIWVISQPFVKKLDAAGSPLLTIPATNPWESGSDDYHFNDPRGIAFDDAGRLFVSDSQNHRIQVYDLSGATPTYQLTIGVTGVSQSDNTGFNQPAQIAFDGTGRLYVMDPANYRVQRCIKVSGPPETWTCSTFFGVTGESGTDLSHLSWAFGITIRSNQIFLADGPNARVLKCTTAGTCSLFAGVTAVPGSDNTHFLFPADVAIDSTGNVYVSDWNNHRIQKFNSSGGYISTKGVTGVPYVTDGSHLNTPWGVALAPDNSMYILENMGYRLIKLNAAGAFQWSVGQAGVYGNDNAHLGSWWAGSQGDPAIDASGRVYVGDTGNDRVQIFTSAGAYYGTLGSYGTGNYEFSCPADVAISPVNGDIYVADHCNQRVQVFTSGLVYKATVGATGTSGSDNLHFNNPWGVTVDSSGNIYVADSENHRIQKCILISGAPGYSCSTFAGETGVSGGDFGHLAHPLSVKVDASGRVYVADEWNNRVQVFDSSGAYLTTIAGAWNTTSGGMISPSGIALDGSGNVYVADRENHRIQKFTPGTPGWVQTNINGFGEPNNFAVNRMSVFNNYLYASTNNDGTGGEVWRTADGTNWDQVNQDGFGTASIVYAYVDASLNGYLYVGANNGATGGEIWRCATCDGSDWEQVVSGGFGDINNYVVERVVAFAGTLYATTNNGSGVEVWKSSSGDSGSWTQSNVDGFGDSRNTGLWATAVFNGYLYTATGQWEAFNAGTQTGIEVWRTNGSTWSQVNPDGFGDPENVSPRLEPFNGYLYAASVNYSAGAQVWRCATCDGTDWTRVVADGFGESNNLGANFLSFDDRFFIGTYNTSTGTEIWQTVDGTSWSLVSKDGFGDSNNVDLWSGAVFNGRLYVGTAWNSANGGEIWRKLFDVFLPLVRR